MKEDDRNALIGTIFVLILGYGFAFVGSNGAMWVIGAHPFAVCVILAFAIQWIAFVPAYLRQTEAFFDLAGGISYIAVVMLALVMGGLVDARSIALATMVVVWAGRLAWFLFRRVRKAGKDGRFDALKPSFVRFLGAWTLQGLWVTFTLAAALSAITSSKRVEFGWFAAIGSFIWVLGFLIEVIADRQKSRFASDPGNGGRFIDSGLWARSRHPNYFGEIVLWVGVAVIAIPVLQGWQWLTLSSPVFVTILLTRVSGIPLLEKRADEKWAGQLDYETYKKSTPVLVPRFRLRDS